MQAYLGSKNPHANNDLNAERRMASVLRHRDCHQAESLINTLDDHQVPRTLKINNNVTLLQNQRSQAHMRLVECEEEFPLAEQLCEIALRQFQVRGIVCPRRQK